MYDIEMHEAEHSALETVATFLRGLREDEWFHRGD